MKVYFDPQAFLRQRAGGISRLFTDLIHEFDGDATLGIEAVLPYRLTNNVFLTQDLPGQRFIAMPKWVPRGLLYAPWWLRGSRTPSCVDLVHRTYFSGRFLGGPGDVPQVVTIYDMIPELFAGTDLFTGTHLAKREYVEKCDLVICISESTRRDMTDIYGEISARTAVVPLAVQSGFRPHLQPVVDLPSEYLLYVGKRDGYKDFLLLADALQCLVDAGVTLPLVVVGAPLTREEAHEFQVRGLAEGVRRVSLDDEQLRRAFSNCTAVVQTSRYEGFGLTPLEGMASGVPVVVARSSSMPEVCGDAGLYFEPGDSLSLASAILTAVSDETARKNASERGLSRARTFSTRVMAERTASLYGELLGV